MSPFEGASALPLASPAVGEGSDALSTSLLSASASPPPSPPSHACDASAALRQLAAALGRQAARERLRAEASAREVAMMPALAVAPSKPIHE